MNTGSVSGDLSSNKPLVSIIICCHNRAHLLPDTIASVLAQKYAPVEIIVFDDGSTDNTAAVLDNYKDQIKYFRQENQGIAIARTEACKLARGEYIAFLDDDDLIPPERIDHLYNALRRFPTAVYATGDWELIDESGNLTGTRSSIGKGMVSTEDARLVDESYEAVLWPRVPVAPHTTLFRRADGERIGWFDRQFRYASEDKDFFARLAQLGPIVYVPVVVSYYRRGHESLTANSIRTEYGALFFFRKHLQNLGPEQKMLRQRLESRIYTALQRIALYRSKGVPLPGMIPENYLDTWLSEINAVLRIKYRWYARIKLPIRRILRG